MLRFGTDGVRGVAGVELTPEYALSLGRAAARVLGGPRFLVGRDTRESGSLLEAALAAGMAAEGVDVELLGVLPTPGVAWHAARDGVPAAMISASHNPYQDNGIKLFAAGGLKLSDDVEQRIEAELGGATAGPVSGLVRRRVFLADEPYQQFLVQSLDGRGLDGIHVVVDCANGAASHVAPAVLEALGARVDVMGAEPDGRNINDGCGSTHPEALQRRVVEVGADVGLAFDGDADRVLAVDARGRLVDGHHLIAICAIDLAGRGLLAADTVVVTVMTNLGFRLAMAERGITVVETAVGDRYVLEALGQGGFSLGGEQSGHLIFSDLATTGDGILSGLQVLDLMARSVRPLADLAAEAMTSLPQVLRNVKVKQRGLDVGAAVAEEVAAVEGELGERGRVLIRPSGTEPLVRVMVEAPTAEEAESAAARLAAAVERVS
ncbi:MAG: phosphoglucosamine mutase [Acidobacteria bacterium]|nr:phosphoglucosamine mutase [Acidobacteriota bacterium]